MTVWQGRLYFDDFFCCDLIDDLHIRRVRIVESKYPGAVIEIMVDRYHISELPDYTLVMIEHREPGKQDIGLEIQKVKTADLPALCKTHGKLHFASEPEYNEYQKLRGCDNGEIL